MTAAPLLQIDDIAKSFGDEFTLGPVRLSLAAGSTIGLLGKNGAGKSTLFKIVTGNMDPSSGKVYVAGERMRPETYELKRRIGYMPQDLSLPRWVTAEEVLSYACRLYEFNDADSRRQSSLKYWDCDWYAGRPLAACSHGMQKRVGLALATIHDPELLILDEPFSGLDLFHIRALEDIISRRAQENKATIVCTHIAPYAARLCDRIVIVDEGKLSEIDGWQERDYVARIDAIESLFFGASAPA